MVLEEGTRAKLVFVAVCQQPRTFLKSLRLVGSFSIDRNRIPGKEQFKIFGACGGLCFSSPIPVNTNYGFHNVITKRVYIFFRRMRRTTKKHNLSIFQTSTQLQAERSWSIVSILLKNYDTFSVTQSSHQIYLITSGIYSSVQT